jgi:hypothetical protein
VAKAVAHFRTPGVKVELTEKQLLQTDKIISLSVWSRDDSVEDQEFDVLFKKPNNGIH